jgi:Tol biopolymer transport system component
MPAGSVLVLASGRVSGNGVGVTGSQADEGPAQRAATGLPVLVVGRANRVARALPGGPPAISADGRYVAFVSDSDTLVAGDENGTSDVFLRDTVENRTILVSRSLSGGSAAGYSVQPSLSADGQVVAFTSSAHDLVEADSNETLDVFVHDLRSGRIDLISRGSNGELGNRDSYSPSLSADGRYVAFSSLASNLDPRDQNDVPDVYRHDRVTGQTILISLSSDGRVGGDASGQPSLSADGQVVAFTSLAALHPDDSNADADVYVRDVQAGATELVSRGWAGDAAGGGSTEPVISADGRVVAFTSSAPDLVPDDDNGQDDVFTYSREDGDLRAVSTTAEGRPATGSSHAPSITADGRRVAFLSDAPDLAAAPEQPADGPVGAEHAYVRDLDGAGTALVGFAAGRVPGDGESSAVAISGEGNQVAFTDSSTNLAGQTDSAGEPQLYVAPIWTAKVPRRADQTGSPPPETT